MRHTGTCAGDEGIVALAEQALRKLLKLNNLNLSGTVTSTQRRSESSHSLTTYATTALCDRQ